MRIPFSVKQAVVMGSMCFGIFASLYFLLSYIVVFFRCPHYYYDAGFVEACHEYDASGRGRWYAYIPIKMCCYVAQNARHGSPTEERDPFQEYLKDQERMGNLESQRYEHEIEEADRRHRLQELEQAEFAVPDFSFTEQP